MLARFVPVDVVRAGATRAGSQFDGVGFLAVRLALHPRGVGSEQGHGVG